jgi:2-iminobutanoate/2-iminopropanoate deaminase
MNTIHNPKTIHAPVGDIYSHGVEVPPNARVLWVAGEVGITPAGDVVKGFEAQARTAWENIAEVLKSAGMGYSDLVKKDTYLVGLEYYDEYVDLEREILGEAKPASKAIIVPSLVLPGLLIEIEVVAAKS